MKDLSKPCRRTIACRGRQRRIQRLGEGTVVAFAGYLEARKAAPLMLDVLRRRARRSGW